MRKKIKIFESGNYPRHGNYPPERVKRIFSKTNENAEAIFLHSSNWKGGADPVVLGKPMNFEIQEDKAGKVKVYADLELNATGKQFYDTGVLKGVSVEIPGDKLTKIALLPNQINPAVKGAEFAEQLGYFEFMEIETETEKKKGKKVENMDKEEVLKSMTKEDIEKQADRLGIVVSIKPPEKTLEEVKAEAKAELEGESKVKEFMESNKKKITPALAQFVENLAKVAVNSDQTFEFNEKKTNMFEGLTEFMKNVGEHEVHKDYTDNIEFDDKSSGSKSPFQAGQEAMGGK